MTAAGDSSRSSGPTAAATSGVRSASHEKPWVLRGRPHGTQVVLLGQHEREDTTQAPKSVTEGRQRWITRLPELALPTGARTGRGSGRPLSRRAPRVHDQRRLPGLHRYDEPVEPAISERSRCPRGDRGARPRMVHAGARGSRALSTRLRPLAALEQRRPCHAPVARRADRRGACPVSSSTPRPRSVSRRSSGAEATARRPARAPGSYASSATAARDRTTPLDHRSTGERSARHHRSENGLAE